MKRKYAGKMILAIFIVAFIDTFTMIGCKRAAVIPAATGAETIAAPIM